MSSEAAILERIIKPQEPDLNKALAEYLLSLDFTPSDHERMNELSAKAQTGRLTPDEEQEFDSYLSMGHFLAFLQSKARITLRSSSKPG